MTLEERTPVPIIQDEWEFGLLIDLYLARKPKRVLEVGTYTGGTLYHWLACASPESVIVSVDMYEDADNRHLYSDWAAKDVSWIVVAGNSNHPATAAEAAKHGPYDWIFIDAGHRDAEIRADVDLYLPLVAEGGVVAFHDVTYYEELAGRIDVHKVWGELRQQYKTIEYCTPGAGGIGVLFT